MPSMKDNDETLVIDDREVRITNPARVVFPERGETKLDLVKHYLRFAEPLMRTMGGRPLLLQRFPEDAMGSSFYQKRVPSSAPPWLETTTVATPNGTESRALVAADLAHLAWAVNLGCLGFHVWPYLAAVPEFTDELRLDLDPQPGSPTRLALKARSHQDCPSPGPSSSMTARSPLLERRGQKPALRKPRDLSGLDVRDSALIEEQLATDGSLHCGVGRILELCRHCLLRDIFVRP